MASTLSMVKHLFRSSRCSVGSRALSSHLNSSHYSSAAQLASTFQDEEVVLGKNEWDSSQPLPCTDTENVYRKLVFLGCPGVGKGTYASRLARFLGVPHIAMGDLVRNEIRSGKPLANQIQTIIGKGALLPDNIVLDLLSQRLSQGSNSGEAGFILDGFPRNTSQAEILGGITSVDLVVNLRLREDVLVSKCVGRRICSQCGGNYNLADINFAASGDSPAIIMPPLSPPSECLSKMTQRSDDTAEVVKARLEVYRNESKPVENYYNNKGLLLNFDVLGGIPETWPRLLNELHLDGKLQAEKVQSQAA